MCEIIISTVNLILNLIYDTFVIQEIINIVLTRKEWFFTKIILSIILFILINILLMNVTDNFLISLKINGSYCQYEMAIEAENNINKKKEENDNNEGSTDESSGNNSNNNNNKRMNTSVFNVNNIENSNNVNKKINLNNINENNVSILVNNNLNKSNLIENNNEMNNNVGVVVKDMKSSVLSTVRLIKNDNDNDMNKNLGENEEVKY